MIGSPAVRCSMDSTKRSPRRSVAPTWSPAAISAARPAMASCAGRSLNCLRFGFTKRDLIRVPSDRGQAGLYSPACTQEIHNAIRSNLPVRNLPNAHGSVGACHPIDQLVGGLAQRVRARCGLTTGSGVTRLYYRGRTADYAEFVIGRAFARPVG